MPHKSHLPKIATVSVIAAVLAFVGILLSWKHIRPQPVLPPAVASEPSVFVATSPLTGLPIPPERATLPILAVMVENAPLARPQSGLSKADIVYEATVEGGITRFMALYQSEEADVVGPVRSARTYFAEIVREYDAWYAHVGGNADALVLISKYKLNNLDQFRISKPFWRDAQRQRERGFEHSVYADTNKLREYVSVEATSFLPWTFTPEAEAKDRGVAGSFVVPFSTPTYDAMWDYSPASNTFKRVLAGHVAFTDAKNGEQIEVKNVIIQYVNMEPMPNPARGDEGALNMELIGSGSGILLRDGKSIPLTWKKTKTGERTQYSDASGNPLAFAPGKIWVELAPPGSLILK